MNFFKSDESISAERSDISTPDKQMIKKSEYNLTDSKINDNLQSKSNQTIEETEPVDLRYVLKTVVSKVPYEN